jgi:hypothetical protein
MATSGEQVLRTLWEVDEATDAARELDDATPAKVCKRMRGVTFDGMAEPGTDLRQAWRDLLARDGKLQGDGETIRDLVLGREQG